MPLSLPDSEKITAVERAPGVVDDIALVGAAQSGDPLAFIELCQRHSRRLICRINRITKNWEDAEDALQDTLLNAYRNLGRFESRCAFSSWLTAIGINSALMLLRRKRIATVSLDESYDFFEISEPASGRQHSVDPENDFEWHETQFLLNAAIRRLPRVLRTVIEMRVGREYSIAEIARALRISESAVKSRLSRARSKLRHALWVMSPELETDSVCHRPRMPFQPAHSRLEAQGTSCGLDAA